MEAQNGQDVEMQDAEQQQQQQQPQPQPESLPEEAQSASSSLSQPSSDPIPQSTSLTSQAQPNQETQEEPSFEAEDEEVDEDADETQEGQDQDQDQEEEEDGETNTDAAPSEDGAASEGGSPSKDDPDKSKGVGRPRGRPPGAGSKVHRGNGRGPLTLSRRARGRPRGPNARPLGPGPHIHEGNIVRGTPAVGAEGGEGTEDGEAAEPSNFGGKINVGGKEYELQGDELALDPDEDGDKKIDAKGNLLGGREWKIHAFCSPMRPDPECVYLLSIDAARAAGYRDSLYFFRKNPLLVKLNLMQGEKDVLIDGGRLSGTLRGRNVTMVAARNVFKLHGPRIVKNGRAVTDDYYEAKARAAGKREGEKVGPAEADDPAAARRELDKQRASARKARDIHLHQSTDHNGEPVYTQFCDSGEAPFVRAEGWLLRKQQLARSDITEKNWKMEMAKSVRGINREITEARRSRKEGWEWDWEGGQPSSAREDLEKEELESREIIGKLTGTPRLSSGGSQEVNSGKEIGSLGYTRRSHLPGNQNDSRSSTPNTALKRALEEKEETQAEPKRIRTEEPPLGVYDPYTGQVHFPKSLQSERARLEKISARARFEAPPGSYSSSKSTAPILGGLRVGREAWGLASFDHYLSDPNPPPFPASREGNVVIPGGEPMNDGEEEVEVNRASVVPGATEEQESRETPDPNASAAAGGQNAGSLASNAPQNRVGPNKKLGRAGQGLVARAAMWKAR